MIVRRGGNKLIGDLSLGNDRWFHEAVVWFWKRSVKWLRASWCWMLVGAALAVRGVRVVEVVGFCPGLGAIAKSSGGVTMPS